MYADGYAPREIDVAVVEQHPTLVNVTLHSSKVKIDINSLYKELEPNREKVIEEKEPYLYYTPSLFSMPDDSLLLTVSEKVSFITREDSELLTSFWGLRSVAATSFSFYSFLSCTVWAFHVFMSFFAGAPDVVM